MGEDAKEVNSTASLVQKNGFSISSFEEIADRYADIYYAAVLPNEWINCGFGMNSTHADALAELVNIAKGKSEDSGNNVKRGEAAAIVNSVIERYWGSRSALYDDLYEVAGEIQGLERLAPVCLAGKPENMGTYGKYLKRLFETYQSKYADVFQVLVTMEKRKFMLTGLWNSEAEAFSIIRTAQQYYNKLKES